MSRAKVKAHSKIEPGKARVMQRWKLRPRVMQRATTTIPGIPKEPAPPPAIPPRPA